MAKCERRPRAPRTLRAGGLLWTTALWLVHAGPIPAHAQASVAGVGPVGHRDFQLRQPVPETRGGIFVHDLNGDGKLDFVVTSEGHIGGYDHEGEPLWANQGEIALFEHAHHPSAIAGDLDGDGRQEVALG